MSTLIIFSNQINNYNNTIMKTSFIFLQSLDRMKNEVKKKWMNRTKIYIIAKILGSTTIPKYQIIIQIIHLLFTVVYTSLIHCLFNGLKI